MRCLTTFLVAAVLATSCSNDRSSASAVHTPSTAARLDTSVPSTTSPAASPNNLSCADAVTATLSLDAGQTPILDQMSLTGGTGARALQTVSSGLADASQRLRTKLGLLTYGDREVTLEVPEGESFWFAWGNPWSPTRKLTIRGCSGPAWTVFAGGFWTDRPKCVNLIIRTAGREATASVGLGDPCPGQLPPNGYTER